MDPTPLASFLAGAVLTTVLPLALLLALSVWYWLRVRHVPDTDIATRAPGVEEPAEATSAAPGESGASH